ncbi:MAG: hypothetical protein BWK76_05080 [Desulfobulbaceae bacterium A2]|nr:MAG: hypothetical protein BWK76_05080 [Desulfobulbaceae bacterium A2]
MELRHLRYFVAVAEELHFGRAAERLHMAQPPLSQQIRALEEELGVRLFTRTSRSVALTPAGVSFVQDARDTLARVEEAARRARRIQQGEAGEIRVGYMNPVMDAVLCRALATFRAARPQVVLRLRELPSPAQLEELRAVRLDVAFIRLVEGPVGQNLPGFVTRVVLREPYVLALPQGHRLTALPVIPLAAAGAEPLIFFPRATMPGLHDSILAVLRASGASPEIVQEVSGKHASLALVAACLGVCLVPASARDWQRRGVELRPLEPGLPEVAMAAVWPEGVDNAAVLALVDAAA